MPKYVVYFLLYYYYLLAAGRSEESFRSIKIRLRILSFASVVRPFLLVTTTTTALCLDGNLCKGVVLTKKRRKEIFYPYETMENLPPLLSSSGSITVARRETERGGQALGPSDKQSPSCPTTLARFPPLMQ